MNNLFDVICEVISAAWDYICEIFVSVVLNTVIQFYTEVVEYFKSMALERGVQIPFVFGEDSPIADQLEGLKKEEHSQTGIYEGVFNDKTEQIESLRWVGAPDMDEQTESMIKNKDIIVLN